MIDNQAKINSLKLDKLREIMVKMKFKDDVDFAKAIGISQGYLSEIFNGKKQVPKTMASRLKKSLNINDSWFDDNRGEMFLESSPDNSGLGKETQYGLSEKEMIIDLLKNNLKEKEKLYESLISEKDERLKDKDIIIASKEEELILLKEKVIEYEKKISTSTQNFGNEGHAHSTKRPGK